MKTNILFIITILFSSVALSQTYYVYTATGNGQWNNPAIWSIAPRTDGKKKNKVVIPAGRNIVADNNVNSMPLGDVEVIISGKLTMTPSTTLLLSAASRVELAGGEINGNANTQQIRVGGVIKYEGSKDLAKVGFSYADNTTGVSPNGFAVYGVMPVNFEAFSVRRKHKQVVEVEWTTSHEVNNRHFTVERSSDGVRWEALAVVQPNSSGSLRKKYAYADQNAPVSKIFYRIAQTDIDGSLKYSTIQSVSADGLHNTITIYKSGSAQLIVEEQNVSKGTVDISIVSLDGIILHRLRIKDQQRIYVNVSKPLSGVYVVRVEKENASVSKKIFF